MPASIFLYNFSNEAEKFDMDIGMGLSCPKIVDIKKYNGQQLVAAEGLRYFQEPKLSAYPLKLYEGYESYQPRAKSYNQPDMKQVESYLMSHKIEKVCGEESDEVVKIFAKRCALNQIMSIPYCTTKPSDCDVYVRATKFKDAIYLAMGGEEDRKFCPNDTFQFKFRQLCLSEHPDIAPKTDEPIDENIQTYCVYRSRLKEFDILYSAEITGVISDHELKDLNNFDELNETKFILLKLLPEFKKPKWRTDFRVMRWWIQAYLTGTKEICFGFKNKHGEIALPVQQIQAEDLAKDQVWKPHVCVAYLHKFLTLIKKAMSKVDCPYTTFEFHYKARTKCVFYNVFEGKTKYSFLSEKFIEDMLKN